MTAATAKYSPYPAYKPSGIAWLGEIPEHWSEKRLRYICRLNPGRDIAGIPDDAPVSFLPMEKVGTDGRLQLDDVRTLSEVRAGYTAFQEDDIVVAKITPCFENGKGALCQGLSSKLGFGSTEFHVLRVGNICEPRFAYWLSITDAFRKLGTAYMTGVAGQQRVPTDFLADYLTPLPPLPEQQAIADFLDRETGRIDALIEKKRRLIELLEEKRSALISHAVTKGLDPDAPMKDSGIEWLGHIPAHWEVVRIKRLARMESGHTPDRKIGAYWEDCDIPWVSLNDTKYLRTNDYIEDTAIHINALGLANSSARILPAGAVVFTRDATIGLAAITTRPMAVSQHIIAWICRRSLSPEFLLRIFDVMVQELDRLTMGATIKTIGMPDVSRLVCPLPPHSEQLRIVHVIQRETGELDALVQKNRELVVKLQEYRTALISAVVTGRIDVREDCIK